MPTHRSRPYLLEKSSQSNTIPVDPQPTMTLADIMARLNALTQVVDQNLERLVKLETACE